MKAGDNRHLESLTLPLNTFGSFPQLAAALEHSVNDIVSLVKANAQLRAQLLAKEQELNKCKQDYSSLAESLHRSGVHSGVTKQLLNAVNKPNQPLLGSSVMSYVRSFSFQICDVITVQSLIL